MKPISSRVTHGVYEVLVISVVGGVEVEFIEYAKDRSGVGFGANTAVVTCGVRHLKKEDESMPAGHANVTVEEDSLT